MPATAADPVLARMGELLGTPIASEVDVVQLVRYGLTAPMWSSFHGQCPPPADLFIPSNSARLTVALQRRFMPGDSDAILRGVRLAAQAWVTFGDLQAARRWLETPVDVLPGFPPTPPWALATCDAGARLCQALLGMGTAVGAAPPVPAPTPGLDVDALLHERAQMTSTDLDWAAALEEQRAAALPEVPSAAVGSDVDVDALLADVAVDAHDALWAEAMAEQRAAEQTGQAEEPIDTDALIAGEQSASPSWQTGASAEQLVRHAEHEGLVASRAA